MKLCILRSATDPSPTGESADHDIAALLKGYLDAHTYVEARLHKATAIAEVRRLRAEGFEVFINLCDGAWEEPRAGVEVVEALSRQGLAFTGATRDFYEPSRLDMKLAAHAAGVATPASCEAHAALEAEDIAARLGFPLIVKHPNGYGSVGLTPASRVDDVDALRLALATAIEGYGAALVERYIAGREFTVLVAEGPEGPVSYTPVEFIFPPGVGFKHYALKWVDHAQMQTRVVEDGPLADTLRRASERFFAAMSATGYGRCDFRLGADERLYLLEINPNCGIFYPPGEFGSADFILAASPGGHRGFLETILATALRRQRALRPRYARVDTPEHGPRLVAAEDLAPHQTILSGEGARWNVDTVNITAIDHDAEAHTGAFRVTRGGAPSRWLPLLSASPDGANCAWRGLDLVATAPIARGALLRVLQRRDHG